MQNYIENEIRATESLSIWVAEVITARSININTDYLLSDINKALRGCTFKIRKNRIRIQSYMSKFHFYPFSKLLCFSQTWEAIKHTRRLPLTRITSRSILATLDVHHHPKLNFKPWLKTCTCPVFMQRSHRLHVRGNTFLFFFFFLEKNNERFESDPVTQKIGSTTCNKVIFAYLFFQNAFYPTNVWVFNFVEGGGALNKAQYITGQNSPSVENPQKKSVPKGRNCM